MALPDYHLLFRHNQIRLNRDPRENGQRPAIDVTFRSAAYAYQQRVIGVILTGASLRQVILQQGQIKQEAENGHPPHVVE